MTAIIRRTATVIKATGTDSTGASVMISYFVTGASTSDRRGNLVQLCERRARLPADHFPRVLDSGVFNGNLFLVEQVPVGASLAARRLALELTGNAAEILKLAGGLATALGILHDHGLIHGRLDPDCVFLENGDLNRPILLDVGESLEIPEQNSEPLLRLFYLAPERFGHVDDGNAAAGDLYSLGILLYHVAHGSLPFGGGDLKEIAHRVYSAILPPLSRAHAGFPAQLSDIIARLVRKSAKDRYQTARGLEADINTLLNMRRGELPQRTFALGRSDPRRELNYDVPVVGRIREKKVLADGLASTMAGRGVFQVIAASSGMGKSKLARDFLVTASDLQMETYSVKFSTFESNVPLSAMSRILQTHAERLWLRSVAERQAWRDRLLEHLGSRGSLLLRTLAPYEGLLPDFPPHPVLPREEEERLFFTTFAEFFALMTCGVVGTLLFIDDLQWADSVSLQLLGQLAAHAESSSLHTLQVVGAYRSEEVMPTHPLVSSVLRHFSPKNFVTLGLLSPAETGSLVELLLDDQGPMVDQIKEFVGKVTDGMPYNVYQVLETIVQQVSFGGDQSAATTIDFRPFQHLLTSSGLGSLTRQRLEQLSSNARCVAGLAAVAGASIDRDCLRQLYVRAAARGGPRPESDFGLDLDASLQAALEELEQEHVTRCTGALVNFVHDRIQTVAWELVDSSERRELHQDYGVILALKMLPAAENADTQSLFEVAHHLLHGDTQRLKDLSLEVLSKAGVAAIGLFAYRKAKDYLGGAVELVPPPPTATSETDAHWHAVHKQTWLHVCELYADALALSEQIKDAISVYESVLKITSDPAKRAAICGKLCINYLYLLNYVDAIEAGINGHVALGRRYIRSDLVAILVMIIGLPWLLMHVLWFRLFGRQTREVTDANEDARLRLLMAIQVPVYWTQPLCAIANFIEPTCRLLYYKDCSYRATMLVYWAVATSAIGWTTISRKLNKASHRYYDCHSDPVGELFAIFSRAALIEFAVGEFETAKVLLEKSIRLSIDLGESFWRAMGYQIVIHIDSLGGGGGEGLAAALKLAAFQRQIGFAATALASSLPTFHDTGRTDDLQYWQEPAREVVMKTAQAGLYTMDSIYYLVSFADVLIRQGKVAEAVPLLRTAVWNAFRAFHRFGLCLYGPVLLAQAYARLGRPLHALVPLAFAWINVAMGMRVFRPQIIFATGEVLTALRLKRLGLGFMRRGVQVAVAAGWHKVVAELRLQLGEYLVTSDPEQAVMQCTKARDFFQQSNLSFTFKKSATALLRAEAAYDHKFPRARTLVANKMDGATPDRHLKKQIEVQTIIDLFLQLSVVTNLTNLVATAVDALMASTGADHSVIYLKRGDSWRLQSARGIGSDGDLDAARIEDDLDMTFLKSVMESPSRPVIRQQESAGLGAGAVMVVPLLYEGACSGLVYLGHRGLRELFAADRLEVVVALARQIAISLRNFHLLQEVQELNSSLEQHLANIEGEVSARTREIRSIFQAIELGIMVITPGLRVHHEYSKQLELIYGTQALAGRDAVDVIFADSNASQELRMVTKHSLDCMLGEPDYTFDLNSSHLPKELQRQTPGGAPQILELLWSPEIDDVGIIAKVLVVVRDVTSHRELVVEATQRRRDLAMIGELLANDAAAVERFLTLASGQLRQMIDLTCNHAPGEGVDRGDRLFILVHTLKGLSRMYHLSFLTTVVHELEEHLLPVREGGAPSNPGTLRDQIDRVAAVLQTYERIHRVTLKRSQAAAETEQQMVGAVARWFGGLPELAREVGKPAPHLSLELDDLPLRTATIDLLASVLPHLISNALDHGIESPEMRRAKGKPPAGRISFTLSTVGDSLVVRFSDDGAGLNLQLISRRAMERQLILVQAPLSREAIAELMYLPGFSTKDAASKVSGRGVGMGAVRALVEEHGGRVMTELSVVPGDTVTFVTVMTLPRSDLEGFEVADKYPKGA